MVVLVLPVFGISVSGKQERAKETGLERAAQEIKKTRFRKPKRGVDEAAGNFAPLFLPIGRCMSGLNKERHPVL